MQSYLSPRNISAQEAAPVFGIKIPDGYRDWRMISIAHVGGLVISTTTGRRLTTGSLKTCFPCHQKIKERNLVFTCYAP